MSRIKRQAVPRAPYAAQACAWCRHKRIRCTGERPVCRTCEAAGRGGECSWGPEPVKRAGNRAYVQSLVHYAAYLEKRLELCRQQHGGFDNDHLSLRPNLPAEDEQLPPSDPEDNNDESMGTFRLEGPGQALNYYGETSVFRFAPQRVPRHLSRFPEIVQDSSLCYVLLVEGVDLNNFNPNFDWSRHLPQEVHFERREHDRLLDLLFKFFTSWCLRIVPALFLRDMCRALSIPPSQPPLKTRHYSPMLHNALIALATAFSDDPRIQDLKFRQYFAARAKSYIDTECHEPDISVMNALSILGSYHSSLGEQTLGYMYFGMSGRVSQALGLSVDCSRSVKENLITPDEMLDRNWGYWSVFSMDVCWSLYVGREFSVAAPPTLRSIPIPPVDSEFDKMQWQYPPSGTPPQPNYLSSTFSATCKLLEIGRRIKEVVHALSSPATRHQVTSDVIFKIDVELNAWKDDLSPDIDIKLSSPITAAPHRIMVQLAFWWLFINLHRPFYRRTRPLPGSQQEIDHVKICDKAARNIMELLAAWKNLYTLRYVPVTLVGVVFTAGTVFLLSALQTQVGARTARSFSHSLSQADLCVEYLLESGKSFQCAKDIAEILRNLLQQELTARSRDKPVASSSTYREPPCIPDSPMISPSSSNAAELVFDEHLPGSPFPTQPYCVWSSETGLDHDSALPEPPSQELWPFSNYAMQAEDVSDSSANQAASTSCSPSSSFQDSYDLQAMIGLSGSMHLNDRLRRSLATFEEAGDGASFIGFEFLQGPYAMDMSDLEMVN